jgi:hypothetical protein
VGQTVLAEGRGMGSSLEGKSLVLAWGLKYASRVIPLGWFEAEELGFTDDAVRGGSSSSEVTVVLRESR